MKCRPEDSRRGKGSCQRTAVLLIRQHPSAITWCKKLLAGNEADHRKAFPITMKEARPNWVLLAMFLIEAGVYSKKTVWYDIRCNTIAKQVLEEIKRAR